MNIQGGILEDLAPHCRFLEFDAGPGAGDAVLKPLVGALDVAGGDLTVGLGHGLVRRLGGAIAALKPFPRFGGQVAVPSTQCDLWVALRHADRGHIANRARRLEAALAGGFRRIRMVDGFKYEHGRDLTGYEDGTENPHGEDAVACAIVRGQGRGLDGGSFVAVQQWLHDFDRFDAMSAAQQDDAIGRHRHNNAEFEAAESAHVKRTAQESFSPEAFVLRRSMPWSDASGSGLLFVAFGRDFAAFEAQINNMLGVNDGIIDGLFGFTMPLTGAYYWCPPLAADGSLDLSALDG